MATVGFGATLSGASVGAVTGLRELAVGGRAINVITHTTLDSRHAKHKEGGHDDGPITATIEYDKTLYDALQTNSEAHAGDTWTYTDADGNTWIGSGFISNLGEITSGADDVNVFALEITPDTVWDHTASS